MALVSDRGETEATRTRNWNSMARERAMAKKMHANQRTTNLKQFRDIWRRDPLLVFFSLLSPSIGDAWWLQIKSTECRWQWHEQIMNNEYWISSQRGPSSYYEISSYNWCQRTKKRIRYFFITTGFHPSEVSLKRLIECGKLNWQSFASLMP